MFSDKVQKLPELTAGRLGEPRSPQLRFAAVRKEPAACTTRAAGWTAAGFLIYMSVIPQAYTQTLCTVVITGAGYWATTRLVALRSNVMARASRPGDQRETVAELAWDLAVR